MAKIGDNICFIYRIDSHNIDDFGNNIVTPKLILSDGVIINKIITQSKEDRLVTYKIRSNIGDRLNNNFKYTNVESYYIFKTKDKLVKSVNKVIYNALSDKTINKFKQSDIFPVLISSKSVDFSLLMILLRDLKKNKKRIKNETTNSIQ